MSMARSVENNYLVLYQGGLGGTWLTWLINQHANFPQYPMSISIGGLDIICDGAGWNIESDGYSKKETFKQSRIRSYKKNVGTKDCIKLLPHHSLRDWKNISVFGPDINWIKDKSMHNWLKIALSSANPDQYCVIDTELRDFVFSQMNPKAVIYPIVKEEMRTEFIDRWLKLGISSYVRKSDIADGWKAWDDFVQHAKPYGDNVHEIDMGKLLSGDIWQYYKLCNVIEEEPLPNINELIADYRTLFV